MASVITNIRGIDVHYEVHNARQEQTIVFYMALQVVHARGMK